MKNALILGAGMVAKPMIDYLLDSDEIQVTSATRTVSKAEKIIQGRKNASIVQLMADDDRELEKLVSKSDIVVSLLPYTYHVKIARFCLTHRKHLVTTSYVSREMKDLDKDALHAGILILNEIGLDPGIDHMSAMRVINNVHQRGGKITAFRSYCGGIPAPENNNNPWGYKFSWSPRGVLMAGRNEAKYLKKGDIVQINGKDLFKHNWPIEIAGMQLETYPNRDSLPYIELYGIPEATTMFRGTLRYPGWSHTMAVVSQLNLLKETPVIDGVLISYKTIFHKIANLNSGVDIKQHISRLAEGAKKDKIISKFEWLGLFSEKIWERGRITPIDFLSTIMQEKLRYESEELDMIVLYHDFQAEFADRVERITSTLIDKGIVNSDSAMSRTVSLPAAIAVKLIMEGKIAEKGVRIPVDKEIYHPVLDELGRLGIVCEEKTEVIS
ncbi:saccharopine dehydrogenase [bacterium SM23_57]|nr:MAG: saccharopine dehydrogenase [bacterium SM23_57]